MRRIQFLEHRLPELECPGFGEHLRAMIRAWEEAMSIEGHPGAEPVSLKISRLVLDLASSVLK
jgi:hypothetical protein